MVKNSYPYTRNCVFKSPSLYIEKQSIPFVYVIFGQRPCMEVNIGDGSFTQKVREKSLSCVHKQWE